MTATPLNGPVAFKGGLASIILLQLPFYIPHFAKTPRMHISQTPRWNPCLRTEGNSKDHQNSKACFCYDQNMTGIQKVSLPVLMHQTGSWNALNRDELAVHFGILAEIQ